MLLFVADMYSANASPGNGRQKIVLRQDGRALLGYCLAYFALVLAGNGLKLEAYSISVMWPAAGLFLAYLVIASERDWPLIALCSFAVEIVADLLWFGTAELPMSLLFALLNALEAVGGAVLLRILIPQPWQRRNSVEVTAYVVLCALITPVFGAAVSAQVFYLTGANLEDALAEFGAWWTGDLLGILLVAPIVGGFVLRSSVPRSNRTSAVTAPLIVGFVVVAGIIALICIPTDAPVEQVQLRFMFALTVGIGGLLWFAVHQEPFIVAIASFCIALAISIGLVTPGTPLGSIGASGRFLVQATQFMVLAVSLAAFLVSLVLFERRFRRELMARRRRWGLVLAELAARLSKAHHNSLDAEIDASLAIIGKHARADRAKILVLDESGDTFSESHGWTREGVEDTRNLVQKLPLAGISDVVESIAEGQVLYAPLSDVIPGSDHFKNLTLTGTRAIAYAPIRRQGKHFGALSLSWVDREIVWTNDLAILLQSSAQVIGGALSRIQSERDEIAYREKLRELAADLNRLDEDIRRETAANVHDGALQSLAVARMRAGKLLADYPECRESLTVLDELITSAIDDLRSLIQRMAPTVLYELGLEQALQTYAHDVSRAIDAEVSLDIQSDLPTGSDAVQVVLYRACRELVTNAIKHAKASVIAVELWQNSGELKLKVKDNGVGIEESHHRRAMARGAGLGLFSLREKLARMDGSIRIRNTSDGTEVIVSIPIGAVPDEQNTADSG